MRKPRLVRDNEFAVRTDHPVEFKCFNAVFQSFKKRRYRVFREQVRERRDVLRFLRIGRFG